MLQRRHIYANIQLAFTLFQACGDVLCCLYVHDLGTGGGWKEGEREKSDTNASSFNSFTTNRPRQCCYFGCVICTDILVELVPCETVVCQKCLITWLDTLGDLCPCCVSDNLLGNTTIAQVTPLFLQFLNVVDVIWTACNTGVPAADTCITQPLTFMGIPRPRVAATHSKSVDTSLTF